MLHSNFNSSLDDIKPCLKKERKILHYCHIARGQHEALLCHNASCVRPSTYG